MKTITYKSNERGQANFGWLQSSHTFSFGQYFNPDRVNFGLLRVFNDDIVVGGAGFPTHPHDNMEIVSIPLKGALAHLDSTGTEQVIKADEVQIMSAGSGLTHSEYNASKSDEVNFLQIWVFPKEKDIKPRYDQKYFSPEGRINKIQTVVAPSDTDALWINQDAWFSLCDLEASKSVKYVTNKEDHGIFTFVVEGAIEIASEYLDKRDAIGVSGKAEIQITSQANSQLLIIEVPMN
ncbi:hypothetical protein SAMN05421640_2292 [Ekhidna lutea]|uniref:Pirin N-terminal domain-containing protein n=1 Tax=Ekhidna lutea TaxID=447679 RepID=A0A239JX86_EKHLU|nr:pirin family protein [Ekhidna lutea]SNT10425.1 hypothetical protein SAMN05421640_2292 [Ekhidna lutea]